MNSNTTKVLQVKDVQPSFPFEVTFQKDANDMKASINPNSVIFKSFNLKDVMISEDSIDQKTKDLINKNEGNLDRHIIKKMNTPVIVYPNQVIFLKVKVSANLNPIEASIEVGPSSAASNINTKDLAWEAFPEFIEFNPKVEFDDAGKLKNPFIQRLQSYAYIPIGYFTSNTNAPFSKSVSFTKPTQTTQSFVQLLKNNLIINTFNYDGYPVMYFTPSVLSSPYLQSPTT